MTTKNKITIVAVIIFSSVFFMVFLIRKGEIRKFEHYGFNKKKRQYTMLLNSYYSTYFTVPQNINDLRRYLKYLQRKTKEPSILSLVINDKINIFYDKKKRFLYLYHFGLDGKDHKMRKVIDISNINKFGNIFFFNRDIVIGGITLYDICNDPLIFRAFYNGYPVKDSISGVIISVLKPKIDSLQKELIEKKRFETDTTILVKSRFLGNHWDTKLVCLPHNKENKQLEFIPEINKVLTNIKLNNIVDSLYFPLVFHH